MCFPDPPIRCVVQQSTYSEPSKVWVQQGRPQKSCWARQHDHATHRASCAHHASVRPSLAPSPRSFLTAAARRAWPGGWETTPASLALQGARLPHGPWSAASPRHRLASSRSAGGVRANVGRSVTASQLPPDKPKTCKTVIGGPAHGPGDRLIPRLSDWDHTQYHHRARTAQRQIVHTTRSMI